MKRNLFALTSSFLSALLILPAVSVQAQTPGQVAVFDQPGTGACNNAGGNDCVDSVITQAGGNIGIGTTTPVAKLDLMGGNLNLENSTATSGNVLKGGVSFISNFGVRNAFFGALAGSLTMTGTDNTGAGYQAVANTTSGGGNTAVGSLALYSNTSGYGNTAGGASALGGNTSGFYNTASGVLALFNNTTGDSNTAIGLSALSSNTTGFQNTASGANALYRNTIGDYNAADGASALVNNTTGNYNSASGAFALLNNTTGNYNVASGSTALQYNTTGIGNTGCGVLALNSNTTGDHNTAVGNEADVSEGDLSNATAVGYRAVVTASNKIRLGNAAVTVVEGPPYQTVSDKNAKENFKPVDAEDVLQKIRALSVTSWNYIGQDATQFRHYGPVAQDFFAAFGDDGVGRIGSPTTITSTDLSGVLLLAVQALSQENADLKARVEAVERLVKDAK